jgi:predicted DNA-binding protein
MEVNLTAELEKKLNELAALSGRPADELVRDAVAGMVDELAETRSMLDRRYDEIKSGKVKLMDGEEAFTRLHERIDARRNDPALAVMRFTRRHTSTSMK